MFGNPALLVAFKLIKLFPAVRFTFTAEELVQVVHEPEAAKVKFAAVPPFTTIFAERALDPLANWKVI